MIFVTGGSGLVGLHVIAALRRQGYPVVALARTDEAARTAARCGAATIAGAVEEAATWDRVRDCAAIVHAAAIIYTRQGWERYRRVNVDATRLAAERARRLGVPLIHISSVAVYGRGAGGSRPGRVGEDWPLGPEDRGPPYPRSKRLAEREVWRAAEQGLRAAVLRPCVVYGEGDRLFLPNLIRRVRSGWFPVVGSGRRPLALVHADSVAEGVTALLRNDSGWGRAYNTTNDGEISAREFAEAVSEGMGRPLRRLVIPWPVAWAGAAAADVAGRLARRHLPEFRAAVRFLRGGNPYTSHAARTRLGWAPEVRHRDAVVRAVREAAGRLSAH